LWLLADINDKPTRATVRVFAPPGQTEIMTAELPAERVGQLNVLLDAATRYSLQITVPVTNLVIPCSGYILVTIETEREVLRAGRIRVIIPDRPDMAPDVPELSVPV
jgi:hypothetical protein